MSHSMQTRLVIPAHSPLSDRLRRSEFLRRFHPAFNSLPKPAGRDAGSQTIGSAFSGAEREPRLLGLPLSPYEPARRYEPRLPSARHHLHEPSSVGLSKVVIEG